MQITFLFMLLFILSHCNLILASSVCGSYGSLSLFHIGDALYHFKHAIEFYEIFSGYLSKSFSKVLVFLLMFSIIFYIL